MKSVAIVGAGPAGLITARKLLQSGQFKVTVFEKGDRIGGSWVPNGIINPNMRTNQSKFTIGFSDLSWESLETLNPVYPKASAVHVYLEEYCKRYIPPETVRFCTTVNSVEQVPGKAVGHDSWKLNLREASIDGNVIDSIAPFDYLVAAPGFYNIMKTPKPRDLPVSVLHSTQYRSLDDIDQLAHPSIDVQKRTILVVGGSHSGGDIAALIALQLSDAQHSPDSPDRLKWKNVEVVHVSSHEMFALPAFIPDAKAAACSFQPVDFTLINRSSRPVEPPPAFTVGLVTPEKVKALRQMVHNINDGNEGSVDTREVDELAPVGVLGDLYPQFVKTRCIEQVRGTLIRLERTNEGPFVTATLQDVGKDSSFAVNNVCAVIEATGFDTPSSLAFLPSEVKSALEYDPSCFPAPFVLDEGYLSRNSSIPTLAIVGYPGAYWPLFEMQARATVHAWTPSPSSEPTLKPQQLEQRSKLREYYQELRKAYKEGRKREVPQNPFGDYIGALEQASRELNLERFDLGFSEAEGFVCSARYTEPGSDKTEAMKTLMEVQRVRRQGQNGGFLARAVARCMMGKWVGAAQHADGKVEVAQFSFLPRYPTDTAYDWEYISPEHGQVWRYAESSDRITIWKVAQDGWSTGAQMSTLDFAHAQQEHGKNTAVAVEVPCSSPGTDVDGLEVLWFHFAGSSLRSWTARKAALELNFIRVGTA